ncbi:hypothetical protein EHS25_007559 [Saitozyma podzolica]|uniref:Uncharacterized protein n=1 Tax=Saitozyma podzolica TaxID=1890683 RepID=A0A427YQ86_9TREE|nr:hypothetical protein EHS25_007559 [Saitozyma podzolica]
MPQLAIRPVVSAPLAGCCTILSIFGVVILVAFGAFYSRHVEALAGSIHDAKDPDAVARVCFYAAIVYAAFVAFCGCQMMVHQRYPRGVQL